MNERKWMNEWTCASQCVLHFFSLLFYLYFRTWNWARRFEVFVYCRLKNIPKFYRFHLLSRIFRTHIFASSAFIAQHDKQPNGAHKYMQSLWRQRFFEFLNNCIPLSFIVPHFRDVFSLLSSHGRLCVSVTRARCVCVIVATWTWIEHMHVLVHTKFISILACECYTRKATTAKQDPFYAK